MARCKCRRDRYRQATLPCQPLHTKIDPNAYKYQTRSEVIDGAELATILKILDMFFLELPDIHAEMAAQLILLEEFHSFQSCQPRHA